jgi:endonuclease-3
MSRPSEFDWELFLDRLVAFYHAGDWRVPYLRDHAEDPFQVLIGTILSQRTRDENTARASLRLFARYPDARSLSRATTKQIEPLIRETGFYHTKANGIRACAQEILDRFDGVVPQTLEELTSLPSVGPKTANCVLVFGYGIPGMPVDTHVHRIANRLGVVTTKTPEETEAALRSSVPERFWNPVNPLLVQHGQNVCRPIGPKCPVCPVADQCDTGIALAAGRRPPRAADDPSTRRSRERPKAAVPKPTKRAVRRVPPRPRR